MFGSLTSNVLVLMLQMRGYSLKWTHSIAYTNREISYVLQGILFLQYPMVDSILLQRAVTAVTMISTINEVISKGNK